MRAKLLPALPAGGEAGPVGRDLHEPHGLPLHRPTVLIRVQEPTPDPLSGRSRRRGFAHGLQASPNPAIRGETSGSRTEVLREGDGVPDAEHRSRPRDAVHRLVRRAELARGPVVVHRLGQSVFRTGLSKVGMPGADVGRAGRATSDRRAARQPLGYATGQFGKNHLGDLRQVTCRRRTASTSSSATCTTSRPRRSREPQLPAGQGLPERSASASAREAAIHSAEAGRPTRTTAPSGTTLRRVHAAHRATRATDEEADETMDEMFRVRITSSSAGTERHTVLRAGQHASTHFRTHTKPKSVGAGRSLAVALPRRDDRLTTRTSGGARPVSTSGLARGHDRHLSTDNGPPHEHVARRRRCRSGAEEHELVRALPRVIRWPGKIAAGVVPDLHLTWLRDIPAAAGEPNIADS